jgi:hypothetical protein
VRSPPTAKTWNFTEEDPALATRIVSIILLRQAETG